MASFIVSESSSPRCPIEEIDGMAGQIMISARAMLKGKDFTATMISSVDSVSEVRLPISEK